MTQRTSSSSLAWVHASYMRASMLGEKAFLDAGRFILAMRTWPDFSTSRCSSLTGGTPSRLRKDDLAGGDVLGGDGLDGAALQRVPQLGGVLVRVALHDGPLRRLEHE